jgi:transcriptional regulator with XRE-family HTH domain
MRKATLKASRKPRTRAAQPGAPTPGPLAERLDGFLITSRIAQNDLARLMGTHVSTVNRIVTGWHKPSPEYVARLASTLGLPPRWLDPAWDDEPGRLSLFERWDLPGHWLAGSPRAVEVLGLGTLNPDDLLSTCVQKADKARSSIVLRTEFPAFRAEELATNDPPPLHARFRRPPLIAHYRPAEAPDDPDGPDEA